MADPPDPVAEAAVGRAMALVSESFIAAAGPGGQNVNKVATAVQLRLDLFALRLAPPVYHRFRELAGTRMTGKGEIVLTERLAELVREAHRLPEKRAKTRLNRIGKTQRLEGKKKRGAVKAGRGKVAFD